MNQMHFTFNDSIEMLVASNSRLALFGNLDLSSYAPQYFGDYNIGVGKWFDTDRVSVKIPEIQQELDSMPDKSSTQNMYLFTTLT